MDEIRRREVARRGGLAARDNGTAHRWTVEDARAAGRKGGQQTARLSFERRMARREPSV